MTEDSQSFDTLTKSQVYYNIMYIAVTHIHIKNTWGHFYEESICLR